LRRLAVALALPLFACGGETHPRETLAIAVPYEIASLDPHAEDKVANFSLTSNAYEGLVDLDQEMKVRPSLAISWESPDALTWLFRLRPHVRFHDGRPLRSDDVVWSLKRVMGRKDLELRNYLRDVVDVEGVDERTIKITTAHPTRVLLNKLAFVGIVPEGSSDALLKTSAIGTGPYRLADWHPDSLRLIRFEGYWGEKPALSEVDFHLGVRPEEALVGIGAGRYQLAQCDSKKATSSFGSSPKHKVIRRDNLYVKYLAFDTYRDPTPFCDRRENPFKDPRVRKAISTALDRPRLVQNLDRYAIPLYEAVPRFVFGFDPGIHEQKADPERARQLMREAGLSAGFRVTLHTRTVLAQVVQPLQEDLRQIGIEVEVKVLPDPEFFTLVRARGASFWLNRFGCASGDASDLLEDMVHSRDEATRYGSINYGGFADRALDKAIEESAAIDDLEVRRDAVQRILRRVTEGFIVVPLFVDQDVFVLDSSVTLKPRADSAIRAAEIAILSP
jgi:peptide/nickel transport system substrate-binding protein